MFEGLVASVLTKALGTYVEDLNAEKLNVSIWGGDVELTNLVIKQSALDELNLGFRVVFGTIRQLTLKIPWTNLFEGQWIAKVEGIVVIANPKTSIRYDKEEEKKYQQEVKKAKLKQLEDDYEKEKSKDEINKEKGDTYFEKLLLAVIRNIQIDIKDIHIRYEDDLSVPGQPFSAGITLNKLSMLSTDSTWQPTLHKEKLVYKLNTMEGLAVYMNPRSQMYSQSQEISQLKDPQLSAKEKIDLRSELTEKLTKLIASKERVPARMNYVIGPIYASTKLTICPRPELDEFQNPKVFMDFEMDELYIGLSRLQFSSLMAIADSFDSMNRSAKFREFRPDVKEKKGNARIWWSYAYRCVMVDIERQIRNWSWSHMKKHRDLCKEYFSLYKIKLEKVKCSPSEEKEIEECEIKLDTFNIRLIRKQAEIEFEREGKKKQKAAAAQPGWFGSWWYGSKTEEDSQTEGTGVLKQMEKALSDEEKRQLHESIGYTEDQVDAKEVYPQHYKDIELKFLLKLLILNIKDEECGGASVTKANLVDVNSHLQRRPVNDSYRVTSKFQSFMVEGFSPVDNSGGFMDALEELSTSGVEVALDATSDSLPPYLVQSQGVDDDKPLVEILFETKPEENIDQLLRWKARPLEIIYDLTTVNQLQSVFAPPKNISLQQLQADALNQLEVVKERSVTGLQAAIDNQTVLDLHIDIEASHIIIPENGKYKPHCSVVVLTLGRLKMESIQKNNGDLIALNLAGKSEEEIKSIMENKSYDHFSIQLIDIQVLLAFSDEEWGNCLKQSQATSLHLLQPTTIQVNLMRSVFQRDADPNLAKVKVNVELKKIALSVIDQRLVQLAQIMNSISETESDPPMDVDEQPDTDLNMNIIGEDVALVRLENTKLNTNNESSESPQVFQLALDFVVKEMCLELLEKKMLEKETRLFNIKAVDAKVTVEQRTFDLTAKVTLGGMSIQSLKGERKYDLLLTRGEALEPLMSLDAKIVSPKVPDFHTKYNSTVQRLEIKVTHLELHLEQDAILSLMKFTDDVSVKLNQLNASDQHKLQSLGRQISKASSITSLSKLKINTGKKKVVGRKKETEIILLHILAEISQFSLVIGIKGQSVTEAAVVGMDLDVKKKGENMYISSKLKDLIVMDPMDEGMHKKILTVVGREVWQANIVMYGDANEDRKLIDTDCVDMSVELTMGQPRIVFLNKYVNQVMCWLDKFQSAKEVVASAGGAAAAAAKANLQEAYKQSFRAKLNITLKAPLILIPQHSTSHSGLLLDLGEITIMNTFITDKKRNQLGHCALFDHIDLQLQNVKISRVNNISPAGEWEDGKLMIKDPISFLLTIERNLTISWFKEKPEIDIKAQLKPIKVILSDEDIQMMMTILQDNIGEEAAITPNSAADKYATTDPSPLDAQDANQILADAGHVYKRISFFFTIEELTLELLTVNSTLSPERSANRLRSSRTSLASLASQSSMDSISSLVKKSPFAKFSIHKIDLKGDMLSNTIFTANMVLNNCILQDTRPGHEGFITKMFERRDASGDKGMIDITFKSEQETQFVQVNISGIKLVLHLPYLLSVQQFFMDNLFANKETEAPPQKSEVKKDFRKLKSVVEENRVTKQGNMLSIRVKVESPDIAVVEDVTSIDTSAIILHTEFNADIKLSLEQQNIGAAMTRLEMYTCCYNPEKRHETMSQILSPCEVSFYTAKNTSHPQIFSLKVGHIDLRVSPATIALLSSISMVLTKTDDTPVEELDVVLEWPGLWEPKPIEPAVFPFLAVEEAMEAEITPVIEDPSPLYMSDGNETGEVQIETILVTLETGSGISPIPLIKLQINAIITVAGYLSKMLKANGQMGIVAVYYNGRLAVWEPLLEPVNQLIRTEHTPWKLDFEVEQMLTTSPYSSPSRSRMSSPIGSPDLEEYEFTPYERPLCSISIDAKDPLELTITKTFMEVQTVLSNAFADAYKQKMEARMGPSAPFRVINTTGMKINVLLYESTFQIKEPNVQNVTLENLACVDLFETKPATPKHKRAFSLISETGLKERSIKIKVPSLNGECNIPVTRADKRYFVIENKERGEAWGLVATISVDGGCKIITLSSSVQVKNHLDIDVKVYYMMEHGNEVDFALKLSPGEELRLPLHAVHTPSAEIFFAIEGHSVSIVPFVWRGLQNRTQDIQELRCNPINIQEVHATPFIISASGRVEQILYEDTSRRTLTSVLYCIDLRPTMVLYNLLPVSLSLDPPGTTDARTWLMPGNAIYLNKAVRGACYLEVQINDYHGRDWVCGKTIELSPVQASVWTFTSLHMGIGGSDTLDLGMHVVEEKGTLSLSLYCPFWMINKTGLELTYRGETSNNMIVHEPNNNNAILFSFKSKAFFGKKKAAVKVENSQWSEKFSLDVVGSSGLLTCKDQDRIYQIGIDIQLSSSGLTKMVVFTPYFKVYNKAPYDVEVMEEQTTEWFTVLSNKCIGWWPKGNCKQLRVRIRDTHEATCPFSFEDPLSTLLRLDNKYGGIYTEVSVNEGGVLVQLRQCEEGAMTALIINHLSNNFLTIWQEEHDNHKIIVVPDAVQYYSWSNPSSNTRLIWALGDEKSTENSNALEKDDKGTIKDRDGKECCHWVVFMFGAQRCLLFTEDASFADSALFTMESDRIMQDWVVDLHSIGLSLVDDVKQKEVAYLCMKSSGVVWEHCKIGGRKHRPFTAAQTELIEKCYQMYQAQFKSPVPPQSHWEITDNLVIEFATNRVLKPFNRKIRRTFQPGLQIKLNSSAHCHRLNMKVNSFQLDNQLTDGVMFPVVLARVPPPRSVMAETVPKPFFETTVHQLVTPNNFTHYKWFAVLVQEFHVKVELPFIYAVLEVLFPTAPKSVSIYSPQKYEADSTIVNKEFSALVASQSTGGKKDYFEHLHLSPIKMHLSFSFTGTDSGSDIPVGGQVIQLFLQSVGVTLTEVQDVVFRLAYMEDQNRWKSWGQLVQEIIQHYQGQVVKQLFVLVLGLDVIGNPFGLVVGLTKGVEDLFYEPIQGAIEGPGEFAEGMLYGVTSFMGKTFGGAAGAAGRITGTLGKGVAALTLDDEYQKRRRASMHRKPTDGIESLARGGKGLVTGVFDGVTGIVTKPVEGAMNEGVGGFFKGVGKGVVGLVTRPASGVIDFASGGFDALKGITDSTEEITQQRPARFISSTGIVEPYNHRNASGAKIIRELEKGRYAMTDYYVAHSMVHGHQSVILATDIRVFQISHNDMMGLWKVDWTHTYEEMAEAPRLSSDQKKLHISIRQLKKRVMGVFGGGDNSKLITMSDPADAKWFSRVVEDVYRKKMTR